MSINGRRLMEQSKSGLLPFMISTSRLCWNRIPTSVSITLLSVGPSMDWRKIACSNCSTVPEMYANHDVNDGTHFKHIHQHIPSCRTDLLDSWHQIVYCCTEYEISLFTICHSGQISHKCPVPPVSCRGRLHFVKCL